MTASSPGGVVRRDPHAVGFIGPHGLRRIDRLAGDTPGAGAVVGRRPADTPSPARRRDHVVEAPDYLVAVVPDLPGGRLTSHDRDLLGQAQRLAGAGPERGAVLVVAFGAAADAGLDLAGADRLLEAAGEGCAGYSPEARLALLEQVERSQAPRYWLFPDSPAGGADLGRRLAARLGVRPATGALQADAGQVVCRAGGGRTELHRPTPRLLLLVEECALPVDETRHEARPVAVDEWAVPVPRIEDCGEVPVDPARVALAEAELILSAGNGVRDWELFHRAAAVLGASEGASRVAVDEGHMPRSRQVGATGTYVTARVYVAVGISGAVQHLQGIGQCEKVVAVNSDPGCDMVRRAELSVIGDSTGVLAALVELVEAETDGEVIDAA